MPLTDIKVKSLKPFPAKNYKEPDEKGLYLLIKKDGSKYWRFKYRFCKKEKLLAFGVYPEISLAQARLQRDEAREQIRKGIDPSVNKKAIAFARLESAENSFEIIANEWLMIRGKKSNKDTRLKSLLKKDLFPSLGHRPIKEITPPELLHTLRRIENRTIEMARRARQYASQIFRYAVQTGRAERDPSADLRGALKIHVTKHFSAITDPKELGRLMVDIKGYSRGTPVVKAALELSALFFCRPRELRYMQWSEVNWEEKRIELPASKMKMRQPHIIPLCTQAIDILSELRLLTGYGKYIFPSAKGMSMPLSENGVRAALRTLGYDNDTMTAHGFRATARTLLDEVLGFRTEWIEQQLAHTVKDANGTAYNRTKHLEQRRVMMQKWADYLDELRKNASKVHTKIQKEKVQQVQQMHTMLDLSSKTSESPNQKNLIINEHITLSEFLSPLVNAVRSVSQAKWVVAEISSISGTSHLYLDLIESDEHGTRIVQLRALIWAHGKSKLISKFTLGTGGENLRKGLKVLLKLKPALSPQYGLSATIEDIDPAFTLGEAAAKLIALRKRLIDEGKYDIQRGFSRPTEFTSVAVICPSFAAGLGDFKSHADPLQNLGLCKFTYYSAIFQGDKTGDEIVSALRTVYADHRVDYFDCLIILRGGGSQADLAWLNDYKIASAISKMPLPVFVAVGHERDSTILDEISNFSFHTPSKAITHISEMIISNAKSALDAFANMVNETLNLVILTFQFVEQFKDRLFSASEKFIMTSAQLMEQNSGIIFSNAMNNLVVIESDMRSQKLLIRDNAFLYIKNIMTQTKSNAEFIVGLGPKKTLERGFTIARNTNGNVITRKKDTRIGDLVSLQFVDGTINLGVQ